MNRRWICGDVWMDILPSFDRPQLGLKMALLSDRFDFLVDKHFDGKATELTIWRTITISKYTARPKAKLSVLIDDNFVDFPFPDRPLPNKIRFKDLRIDYIDHSVIEFLRSNQQIWDRMGTKLKLAVLSSWNTEDNQRIWDVLASEIWPIFATNIRHLSFISGGYFDILRGRVSPTLLTDLDKLHSIDSGGLFPGVIADDGPTVTSSAGQALSKWLHIPTKDGQPKRLFCEYFDEEGNVDWVNSFKETFLRATDSSVSYEINFETSANSIEPFELVNERTKEKLKLEKTSSYGADDGFISDWLLKRCPISEKAAAIQWKNDDENWDDKLNEVTFNLWNGINKSIGPLSPAAEEEKEEADESNDN